MGGYLPASGLLVCLLWLKVLAGLSVGSDQLGLWLYLMIWLSLHGCLLLVLSGRGSAPIIFFSPSPRPGSGARAFAGRLQKKWIKRRPWRHQESMRRRPKARRRYAPGAGLCEQSVTQNGALDGLLDMRKSSDTTAASSGWGSAAEIGGSIRGLELT